MPRPGRLYHSVPGWVEDSSAFHIRLRAGPAATFIAGTDGGIARAMLAAARFYHEKQRWSCRLILIMPDHLHAILSFPRDGRMSVIIQGWKRFLNRAHRVSWQDGYFDHRLRSRHEADECWRYIRQNPVRQRLVAGENEWPWVWWPEDNLLPE